MGSRSRGTWPVANGHGLSHLLLNSCILVLRDWVNFSSFLLFFSKLEKSRACQDLSTLVAGDREPGSLTGSSRPWQVLALPDLEVPPPEQAGRAAGQQPHGAEMAEMASNCFVMRPVGSLFV